LKNIFFSTFSLKIHKGLDSFKKIKNAIVTTGTFDGVHRGHIDIIKELCKKNNNQESVLITFSPHPRQVLFPDQKIKVINTFDEKIELFSNHEIDHLVIQEFNFDFSRISSIEYIRDILKKKIGLKKLIIGHDHHFGRNREASAFHIEEYAQLYDFEYKTILPLKLNGLIVSSTKIRNALRAGEIVLANSLLGYEFSFQGKIIQGKGLGRTIGFPTANIEIENKNKLIPGNGVYAVFVEFENKKYKGMINIGFNPTFKEKKLSIELNIFNFKADIYDKEIKVFFKNKIRDERKFNSIDELKKQLSKDKITAENFLTF